MDEDKGDTIKINTAEMKKGFGTVVDFFKNKKVQKILIIVLLLSVIILGVWIRTQNIDILIDQTTGKHIPTALDPFYFLRLTETILEQGGYPEFDTMRYLPNIQMEFHPSLLPWAGILVYKAANIFGDYSIQYTSIIFPVVLFVFGLILFFFLVYLLTGSKITALISSIFLTILPPYLYRSMAGFFDHEAIGMFSFFLILIGYTFALKFLDKEEKEKKDKKYLYKVILFGALVGALTVFTIASWGGISNFLFMIIPLSFGLFWLIKTQDLEKNRTKINSLLVFYIVFFISTILFGLGYGFDLSRILGSTVLSSTSLLNGVVLLFIISDFFMIRFGGKIPVKGIKEHRLVFSAGLMILLGILFSVLVYGNLFSMVKNIIEKLLHPFETGRVGLTVAENKAPYLRNWMSQTGKILFWLFLGGLIAIGVNISKAVKKQGRKIGFIFFWILLISGILFSKFSSSSMFNGTNFISKLFYLGSIVVFGVYCARLYSKEKLNIKSEWLIIFSWMIFMLIAARGAIRLFFVITPFVCFSVGIFISSLARYYKKSKDDLGRMLLGILLIGVIIVSLFSFNNLAATSISQAKVTGPSAHIQWQQAMKWVRENTPEDSIFLHWWDYGYWVQYLGERPTLADGGHFEGAFRDHMIGRYVLTTPYPETALSFMKTNNASYILIDPTDLGKYPAYSKIGSDENWDRLSMMSVMPYDPQQTQETQDKIRRIFVGGVGVDEDIVYELEERQIFIPGPIFDELGEMKWKSFVGGIILETSEAGGIISLNQPIGIFIYNNQRYDIPIRYVYYQGKIADFESGLDAIVRVIPSISEAGQQISVENLGGVIYLSPKVSKSLFAQLYLMDDPFNNYPTIRLAHSQDDSIIANLKSQGLNFGDFIFFRGFRGPIKIWDTTNIPDNILIMEEFSRRQGDWAEFDNLEFVI
jgi:asparagine N-glycosylation enzyme membrane subunit Stt3